MALEAGAVFTRLGARLDDTGFDRFEKRIADVRRTAERGATAELKGDVDERPFRRYRENLDRAERDTSRFRGSVSRSFGGVRVAALGMGSVAGGAFGLVAKGSVEAATSIAESTSKINTVLGKSGQELVRFSETTATSLGVSKQAALEATGTFAAMFRNLGQSRPEAAEMSITMTKLASDLASFNNASPEEAIQALGAGLRGEAEPLRRFGVLLDDATLRQQALADGLVKSTKDALTPQQKAMASYSVILEQTKTQQGDFERTSGGLANQQRILKARFADLSAEMGERLVPFALKAVRAVTRLIKGFENGTGAGGVLKDALGALRDAFGLLLEVGRRIIGVFDNIKDAFYFNREVVDQLAGVLAVLLARFVALRTISTLVGIFTAVRGAVIALNIAMRANPIGIMITAIALLVGALGGMELGFKGVVDVVAGAVSSILGMFAKMADAAAKLPIVGDAFKGVGKAIRGVQGDIDDFREGLRKPPEIDMSKVRGELRETGKAFGELRKDANADVKAIAKVVKERSEDIKKDLGENSREGREALADNFRKAQEAVRRQMRRGEVATKEGMEAIRGYLADELQTYGLSLRQARNIARTGDPDANRGREGGHLRQRGGRVFEQGGWIGARGLTGDDVIPVGTNGMAAMGEAKLATGGRVRAIINRHQAPAADAALARIGIGGLDGLFAMGGHVDQAGIVDYALAAAGLGGLDGLFAGVTRPHKYQAGGIVPVPGFPGERAASSILDEIASVSRRFGLVLTDAFGPGHKSPGHTVFGTAADFAGPDAAMDAAVRFLVAQGYVVGYDGRFGSAAWPGHGPSTVAGSNAHLHVEFGSGSGAGLVANTLRPPRVTGGGDVGRLVNAVLGTATAGANRVLENALAVPVAGGGTGDSYSKARLAQLWRSVNGGLGDANLMAAIALAESGGRPSIVNSIGAGGLWQIHPPEPGYLDPRTNAAIAGRKLRTQGLQAWEAYTRGMHRQYLRGGGRVNGLERAFQRALNIKGFRATARRLDNRFDRTAQTVADLQRQFGIDERAASADGVETPAELRGLLGTRRDIHRGIGRGHRLAGRLRDTYAMIVGTLETQVGRQRGPAKQRTAERVRDARAARNEFAEAFRDLGFDFQDSQLDVAELERAVFAAENPQAAPPEDTRGDGDTGSTVTEQLEPSPAQIAAAAARELATFQAGRASLFSSFGANYVSRGTTFGVTDQAAGLRYFGGGSGGGRTVHQTVILTGPQPADPHTFTQAALHELRAAAG